MFPNIQPSMSIINWVNLVIRPWFQYDQRRLYRGGGTMVIKEKECPLIRWSWLIIPITCRKSRTVQVQAHVSILGLLIIAPIFANTCFGFCTFCFSVCYKSFHYSSAIVRHEKRKWCYRILDPTPPPKKLWGPKINYPIPYWYF